MAEFLRKKYSAPMVEIEEIAYDIITSSPTDPGFTEDDEWEGPIV